MSNTQNPQPPSKSQPNPQTQSPRAPRRLWQRAVPIALLILLVLVALFKDTWLHPGASNMPQSTPRHSSNRHTSSSLSPRLHPEPTAGGIDALVRSREEIQQAVKEETDEAVQRNRIYLLPACFAGGLPKQPSDSVLYVEINGNVPDFSEEELQPQAYESYSLLDRYGRVGPANAVIGRELFPKQKRGDISAVYPSGWKQHQYSWIEGKSLYTRTHLLAHHLSAEDANFRNLMTGTQQLNQIAMTPFEHQIGDYVKQTAGHVRYRVTPIFVGSEKVARGLQLEAQSIEDGGRSVRFNVYLFNTQAGVVIDYQSGQSQSR